MADEKDLHPDADEVRQDILSAVKRLRKQLPQVIEPEAEPSLLGESEKPVKPPEG